jgi:hypothetical protein
MTTDNFCFYLQNRQIQTSQTGGQWYSDTFPLVFPGSTHSVTVVLGVTKFLTIIVENLVTLCCSAESGLDVQETTFCSQVSLLNGRLTCDGALEHCKSQFAGHPRRIEEQNKVNLKHQRPVC